MPFDYKLQSRVVITKEYHAMLKELAAQNRRTLQAQLEILIEKEYKGKK